MSRGVSPRGVDTAGLPRDAVPPLFVRLFSGYLFSVLRPKWTLSSARAIFVHG